MPRFTFLETIREYGQEQLAAHDDEREVRTRQAMWCLELLHQAWTAPSADPIPPDVLDRVEADLGNIRAALAWFESSGDSTSLLALAGLVAPFWVLRSYRAEGRSWLERGLRMPDADQTSPAVRARAWHGAASLARTQDDRAQAIVFCERGLALYRELGDTLGTAASLNLLGVLARAAGDFAQSTARCDESLALFERIGDLSWISLLQCNLGVLAIWQGDLTRARELLDAALSGYRGLGNQWGTAFTLQALGVVAGEEGDARRAAALLRDSLLLAQGIGAKESQLDAIAGIAALLASQVDADPAARLLGAVEANCQAIQYAFEAPEAQRYAAAGATAQAALGPEGFAAAWAIGHALPLEAAVAEADTQAGRIASGGGTAIDSETGNSVDTALSGLTPREIEVLRLLTGGLTDREIGETLFISHRTAMRHVANILAKLDVNSRTAAAAYAHRRGVS